MFHFVLQKGGNGDGTAPGGTSGSVCPRTWVWDLFSLIGPSPHSLALRPSSWSSVSPLQLSSLLLVSLSLFSHPVSLRLADSFLLSLMSHLKTDLVLFLFLELD